MPDVQSLWQPHTTGFSSLFSPFLYILFFKFLIYKYTFKIKSTSISYHTCWVLFCFATLLPFSLMASPKPWPLSPNRNLLVKTKHVSFHIFPCAHIILYKCTHISFINIYKCKRYGIVCFTKNGVIF